MKTMDEHREKRHVTLRIVICALILTAGWVGMNGLASLKQPPAEAKPVEQALRVETLTVHPRDYAVSITGYGEARALTVVSIAPEVTGRVVHTHPALKVGAVIPRGEVLLRIDPSDYAAAQRQAEARVTQWENTVARLKKQATIDARRLKTLQRSADLAKREFDRVRQLFTADRVGTRSGVDQAERTYNGAADQADAMAQAVSLYPLQIREAESNLVSARTRLAVARTDLSRCTLSAPFDARIKAVAVETGQFVSPGQTVFTLADDTVLEIRVPLDSRDARRWLQFEPPAAGRPATAWFAGLTPVNCKIRWTEDKAGTAWHGTLHRVVEFDQETRTLTVAVRVSGGEAMGRNPLSLPLVDGMFCTVEIPGRTMRQVYRLPRQAVTFQNQVYLANGDHRLQTVDVDVARIEGDHVFVDKGLRPGAAVIVTRLIDPLENSLLDIVPTPSGAHAS